MHGALFDIKWLVKSKSFYKNEMRKCVVIQVK